MKILAHRGCWSRPEERNTPDALSRAWSRGYGVETDLRDRNGALVVSHDPASASCAPLATALPLHQIPPGTTLALNLKADGLHPLLEPWLAQAAALDAFVFDMSVPEQRRYRGLPVFTRHSDLEPHPVLYGEAQGVWLDAFDSEWWHGDVVTCHLAAGKRVAIVSPELHGRDHQAQWRSIRTCPWWDSSDVLLCTDFPREAAETFRVKT
jgi:hypothetical protein